MKQCGIYSITCQSTGKRYIGSSVNINERWWRHRTMLKHNQHYNRYLQRAWNKYGISAFTFDVVEIVREDLLLERETHWIAHFRSCDKAYGFNDKDIANASKLNEDAIARMAAKKRGSKHTLETRAKMSVSRLGRVVSLETRRKISDAQRGRKLSPERVAKMAECARGKRMPGHVRVILNEAVSKTYALIGPQGDEYVVKNLSAFCRELGLDDRRLREVAAGRNKSWHGWKCTRVEVEVAS